MSNGQIKILLVGPVAKAGMIGGASVSFDRLARYFRQSGALFGVVDTQPYTRGLRKRFGSISILIRLLLKLPGAEVVMLNTSRGGTRYLAPLLFVVTRLLGRRFVFRPFGGNLKDYSETFNGFERWIFQHTVLKADLIFLQTLELVEYYAKRGVPTAHLPTSRMNPPEALVRTNKPFRKRFVFLGHLKASKGVNEILEVAEQLPDDYTLHLYGTITEARYKKKFGTDDALYRGELAPREVLSTLSQYDVLILPTYYEGEGYPGVIIEAFSLGLPVITTHWKAIPELVQNGKTGMLIEPGFAEALLEAITAFNTGNYAAYSARARTCFQTHFRESQVLDNVLQTIKNLTK